MAHRVTVTKLTNNPEHNYKLTINNKEFFYVSFPFIKGQDHFEIADETPSSYIVDIDDSTYGIHSKEAKG